MNRAPCQWNPLIAEAYRSFPSTVRANRFTGLSLKSTTPSVTRLSPRGVATIAGRMYQTHNCHAKVSLTEATKSQPGLWNPPIAEAHQSFPYPLGCSVSSHLDFVFDKSGTTEEPPNKNIYKIPVTDDRSCNDFQLKKPQLVMDL